MARNIDSGGNSPVYLLSRFSKKHRKLKLESSSCIIWFYQICAHNIQSLKKNKSLNNVNVKPNKEVLLPLPAMLVTYYVSQSLIYICLSFLINKMGAVVPSSL